MMILYLAIPVNIGLICFTFDMLGDGEKLPASRVWIFFLLTLAACIFEFALERLVPDKDLRTLTQEQRQERRAKRKEKKVQLKRLLELHVSDQQTPRNGSESIEGKTPKRVLKNRPLRE